MSEPVSVTFLGGLGDIGRNCAAIEIGRKIMLLDCGLMFPEADMLGIDLVLPDFSWLIERKDDIVGCIVTHGHEDHHGALAFALRELSFPIIGSALSLGFAANRIDEAGLMDRTEMIVVKDNERRKFGPFDCEFIPVTHSVPHGFATAFHTPQGTILHTGDWKLDLTPVDGRLTDLGVMGAIAQNEGVRLLLGDSTNADQHGHSRSEKSVGKVLEDLIAANKGRRIITACFASHVHRVQQIADAAIANGRVIATLGMSMKKNVRLAKEMGLLTIPDNKLLDIEDVKDLDPGTVCIISTGSQGEPMSALAKMAANESRWITLNDKDTVILSSHPIPGNETNVSNVINSMARIGVRVVHSGLHDVHATGHAKAEEIKTLISVIRPEFMIPVHGEYRHMQAHAELARTMGVKDSNVLICEDGDRIKITDKGIKKDGSVPANYLYVDGIVGDVGHGVIRDRQVLAEEGVVVVIVTVDHDSCEIITGPEVITRGWIYADEAEELLDEMRNLIAEAVMLSLEKGDHDSETLQRVVRKKAGKFVSDRTKRRPMIVPVVMSL
ncbi:ribonuclease J [Aquihabitans sp. McL0605]|uniref:ribonuclease J n=1 Tax=Aquihabitans sp. McL0605 TaxID=3415671 RepID=UPI003CF9CCDF